MPFSENKCHLSLTSCRGSITFEMEEEWQMCVCVCVCVCACKNYSDLVQQNSL